MTDLYSYKVVKIIKIVDGDTAQFSGIDLGFGTQILMKKGKTKPSKRYPKGKTQYYSIRFWGIDTPESKKGWWIKKRGLVGNEEAIQAEITAGLRAKAWTTEMIEKAVEVRIRSMGPGPDNFGRLLAIPFVVLEDGSIVNLCDELLRLGLAKKYVP